LTYEDNFILEYGEDHNASHATGGKFSAVTAETSIGAAYGIPHENNKWVLVNHSGLRPGGRKTPRRQAGFILVLGHAN
jgi:hypothetical protein